MSKVVKLTCELLLISGNVLRGSAACGLGRLRCNRVLLSITSRAISSFEGREYRHPHFFFFFFFQWAHEFIVRSSLLPNLSAILKGSILLCMAMCAAPLKKKKKKAKKEGKKHTRNRFPHYRSRARIISVLSKNLYL